MSQGLVDVHSISPPVQLGFQPLELLEKILRENEIREGRGRQVRETKFRMLRMRRKSRKREKNEREVGSEEGDANGVGVRNGRSCLRKKGGREREASSLQVPLPPDPSTLERLSPDLTVNVTVPGRRQQGQHEVQERGRKELEV
eukprot:767231-Hanusia_phi.AAC.10